MAHRSVAILSSTGVRVGFTTFRTAKAHCGELCRVVARDLNGIELKVAWANKTSSQAIASQSVELARQFPQAKISVEDVQPRAVRVSDRCIRLSPDYDPAGWRKKPSGRYGPMVMQLERRLSFGEMEKHAKRDPNRANRGEVVVA